MTARTAPRIHPAIPPGHKRLLMQVQHQDPRCRVQAINDLTDELHRMGIVRARTECLIPSRSTPEKAREVLAGAESV